MTRKVNRVAMLGAGAVTLLTALVTSCGSGGTASTAVTSEATATGSASGVSSATTGTTDAVPSEPVSGGGEPAGTLAGSASPAQARVKPAGLTTVPYTYGDLLLAAWAKGDRVAAGRYASPDAVLALFDHEPVSGLVNFECGDEDPVVCGWTGAGEAQVILGLDKQRLSKGALQAVVSAKVSRS